MDYTLRPATPLDKEWLWRTKSRCLRGYVEQTWGDWDEDIQRGQFDADFEPGEIHIIVFAGQDAGFIAARNEPQEIQLFNLMVAPEYQKQGLGTAVLEQLLAVAQTLGVPVRLRVMKVNPARRLYERLGFIVDDETPTHYRMLWTPAGVAVAN